jgi:hypothetical protein
MRRVLLALCLLAFSLIPHQAAAQSGNLVVTTCGTLPLAFKPGATEPPTVDVNGNQCISGSISASTTGFAPSNNFANLTTSGVSADVALPAGAVVAVQNTGTTTVSCNFTVGAGTATPNQTQVPASSTVYVTVGGNTHGSCIDQTGSVANVVAFVGGTGLGTGFGGGGGGGGSAFSVTDQAAFTQGTSLFVPNGGVFNDAATLSSGQQGTARLTTKRAHLVDVDSSGNQLHTDLTTPIPGVTQAATSAAASSLVAKASPGSLISVSGSAVANSFIMIFNATSAPADGAVSPAKCWGPMAATGPFAFGWGPGPVLTLSTGITIVSSSTGCFTKTATNANFIAAEFQ